MTKQTKNVWTSSFEIQSYDVDPSCVARPSVFCRFMQEAAYRHAEHLGLGHSHLSPQGVTWVLSRMRLEIERSPSWGETVALRTWPSGRDRLYYYRDFEMTDQSGELLARASTAWFVLDVEKRERVLPDWWTSAEYPRSPKVFAEKLARLKAVEGEEGIPVEVNHGDLDQNGHVSNIRYVEWIMNALPLSFHEARSLRSLEVNYLAEARDGHAVSIRSDINEATVSQAVSADGVDLFRARGVWAPRG